MPGAFLRDAGWIWLPDFFLVFFVEVIPWLRVCPRGWRMIPNPSMIPVEIGQAEPSLPKLTLDPFQVNS